MAGNKPKVAFIGTGGTISSIGRDALDLVDYPDGGSKLEVDELIEKINTVLDEYIPETKNPLFSIDNIHRRPAEEIWLGIVEIN